MGEVENRTQLRTAPFVTVPEGEYVRVRGNLVDLRLLLEEADIARWLGKFGEGERVDLAKRAFRAGCLAFQTAQVGAAEQALRQAIEKWARDVEIRMRELMDQSRKQIEQELSTRLGEKMEPVREAIERAARDAHDRIKERVDEVLAQFDQSFDPTQPSSYLGQVQAVISSLQSILEEQFDPSRSDSYFGRLHSAITQCLSSYFGAEGEASACIRTAINQVMEGMKGTLDSIRQSVDEIRGAVSQYLPSTRKGLAFEREAVGKLLERAAKATGDKVAHVGRDSRPGDWLIGVFLPTSQGGSQRIGSIAVEAKDEKRSLRQVLADLENSKRARGADVSIVIFARLDQNPFGIPLHVVDDKCTQIVCVWDEDGSNLNFAYQLARLHLLQRHLVSSRMVDWEEITRELSSAIREAERLGDLANKARLAKERAAEAQRIAEDLRTSLSHYLNRLHSLLMRAAQGQA